MEQYNLKLERKIMRSVDNGCDDSKKVSESIGVPEKLVEETMDSMVERGLIEKEEENHIGKILINDVLALKQGVTEFREYWNKCEPKVPIEKARKSDLMKYLFSYLRPQSSVDDDGFYEKIFETSKMMNDMKTPKEKKESVIQKMLSGYKDSLSNPAAHSVGEVFKNSMDEYESLDDGWNKIKRIKGDNFVIKGSSPDSYSTFGVHHKFPHMRIDTGGEYIHQFFWDKGGDCYTYALGSYSMLRYFDLDTKLVNFKPIVKNPKPKTKYTHYANVVEIDGNKIMFDPIHPRLNHTFPHKRKTYLKTNETLFDTVLNLVKKYNTEKI